RRIVDTEDRRVTREQEFHAAIEALTAGLYGRVEPDELRHLHAEAAAFGRPIPKELDDFYYDQMEAMARNRHNFERIVVGVSFAAGALLLLALFALIVLKKS